METPPASFDHLSIGIRGNNVSSFRNQTSAQLRFDPVFRRLVQLSSDDGEVLRTALAHMKPLDSLAVPRVIQLLGRSDMAAPAVESLREIATSITGQLLDVLSDGTQDFAVRARIPAVLSASESPRAF